MKMVGRVEYHRLHSLRYYEGHRSAAVPHHRLFILPPVRRVETHAYARPRCTI